MKRLGAFLIPFLMASVAGATALTEITGPPKTFGDKMKEIRAARELRSGIRTEALINDGSVSAVLFQAAGSLQGSNGTFFRSDVTLANLRGIAQNISIAWLPAGQNNNNAPLQFFVLAANTVQFLDDFVAQTLHKSGLGVVVVFGDDANHNTDSLAVLDGYSRIWTPEPGGTGGTNSLQLPGIDLVDLIGSPSAIALGQKQDSGFHCNVGIVNLDSIVHTWTVQIHGVNGSTTFTVTVQPSSITQVGIPAGNWGDLFVLFTPDASSTIWSAYAVTDDSKTGDGWVAHARQ